MEYLLLIVGFVLLVKGADLFVEGSSSLAKKFGVSELMIGLTVVAFGTSAPELAVSTTASLSGSNGIAISNVLGSNIFNFLLVIGTCSIIAPIHVNKSLTKKDFPILLGASLILALMLNDVLLFSSDNSILSRLDGIILLVLFVVFIFITINGALKQKSTVDVEQVESLSKPKTIIYIVVGLIGIVYGGNFIVDSATTIAITFGVSEVIIGLTVVAIGTSLPELVTSAVAAKKGNSDIALGNVIGSNLFNILLILGTASTISPIAVESESAIDAFIALGVAFLVYIFALTKKKIDRTEGIILLSIFVIYNAYILMR